MDGSAPTLSFGPVTVAEQGRVAVITMRRPDARNAINEAMANGLESAIDHLETTDRLWVGVLAGEGTAFCAGADLKVVAQRRQPTMYTSRGGFAGVATRDRDKPLIAAVDGHALAGGAEIALACDLIVASTAAQFAIPEVKRSLIASSGGLFRLPRLVPRGVAMYLAMTGDALSGERAFDLGLACLLTEPGAALEGAVALATRISDNAPLAVRASRRVVLQTWGRSDEEGFMMSQAAMNALYETADFVEGPASFLEKRPPNWRGE